MDPLTQTLLARASQPPTTGQPTPGLQNAIGPTGPNQMGGPPSGPNLAMPHSLSVAPSPGFNTPPATTPSIPSSTGVPAVPPNPAPRVPQAAKRFQNAQAIQDAYRNPSWTPNPVL